LIKEIWDKNPVLILYNELNIFSKIKEEEIFLIKNFLKEFFEKISEDFKEKGSNVYFYDKNSFKEKIEIPFGIILNPCILEINEDILENPKEKIPEVYPPLAISIGKEILKISPYPHPNFMNLIFLKDEKDLIISLDYEKKVNIFRMLMAKLGSFKNIIIPYKFKNEKLINSGFIISTMEGGCPLLKDLKEVSRRLRVFGSSKEVGGFIKNEDRLISYNDWINSKVVNSMIQLGKFLGKNNLLSPPVKISSFVKNKKLANLISKILSYSRLSEGAFMAYDSNLKLFIVTASGKYEVDKSNLTYKDLVPIFPKGDKVEVFNIENIDVKGPSVEAEEFTIPLMEFYKDFPEIISIIHIHRTPYYYDKNEIFEIPQDIEKYPPCGCGVDLMLNMSRYAINYAIKNRKNFKIAIFKVPNHGTNIYSFYDEKTIENPFYYFMEAISKQKLKFKFEVEQV
jgi:hypothetical protein